MNKNAPLVSVIIPNYNHAKYLDERIQSVLNQTYQNFELIILDDCSPDGGESRAVIERYRGNSHVSHIIYNEVNRGSTFKQWYKGMEFAKGELIWIAESDDCCDETFLEKLTSQFKQRDIVFAFCKSCVYDVHGQKSSFNLQDTLKDSFCIQGQEFIARHLRIKNSVANASSVVFRKNDAIAVNEQYSNMRAEGDWLFWIELAERGRVSFINEELNFFRLHDSNTTANMVERGLSYIEHLIVHDYLAKSLELSIVKRFFFKLNYIIWLKNKVSFSTADIRRVVLGKWDPFYLYRLYLFLRRVKDKIKHILSLIK